MKKLIFIFVFLFLVGCSSIFQYTKPNIIEVDSINDVPSECQPVYLNSIDANGLYYMEIEYTENLPEFGWIVVETETLVFEVIPAYPKPSIFKRTVGIAKEPAYYVIE